MLFNSIQFLIFFPIVTAVYFLLPQSFRWAWLLAVSVYFYMVFIPIYILILLITILIDYFAAMFIETCHDRAKKKWLLNLSIVSTCLVLFIFKYFNFIHANLGIAAKLLGWNYPAGMLNIILPIGLSFHTFQSLSYVIEVYRGHQKAERHFGIYALYVMFYPQLVAGPIERPQNLLHQFYEKHEIDVGRIKAGLTRMLWGMFKKVVIADRLAVFVNEAYTHVRGGSGPGWIVATVFFSFQIFCDFSGYSDIAIGAAQVMGFRLMENFRTPYSSRSIAEFWRRWHISLSTWFRDYLYIPMGGSRVSPRRRYFNVLVTFLVSGIWHGANWTYAVWGLLHGFYQVFGLATQESRAKLWESSGLPRFGKIHGGLQVLTTFLLVSFGWIFFRASTIGDAFYIIGHLSSGLGIFLRGIASDLRALRFDVKDWQPLFVNQSPDQFFLVLALLIFLAVIHHFQKKSDPTHLFAKEPAVVRWAIYWSLLMGILIFRVTGTEQFIYFQF